MPKRVLFVDDDPSVRRLAEPVLRDRGGWEVLMASSGAKAIEIAAREPLDAIVLDLAMPEMDGIATLARLRTREAPALTPVILMTTTAAERARARDAGAHGVIEKPFDPLGLPARLARVLEKGWDA